MNGEEKKAIEFLKENMLDYEEIDTSILLDINLTHKTILNLIEKLQKENEELKEENEYNKILLDMNNNFTIDKKNGNYKWNVIEIQKVKDKIEKEIKYHERNILEIENITMLKSKTAKEEAEIEFNKYAIVVLKKILQELIEGREN